MRKDAKPQVQPDILFLHPRAVRLFDGLRQQRDDGVDDLREDGDGTDHPDDLQHVQIRAGDAHVTGDQGHICRPGRTSMASRRLMWQSLWSNALDTKQLIR